MPTVEFLENGNVNTDIPYLFKKLDLNTALSAEKCGSEKAILSDEVISKVFNFAT